MATEFANEEARPARRRDPGAWMHHVWQGLIAIGPWVIAALLYWQSNSINVAVMQEDQKAQARQQTELRTQMDAKTTELHNQLDAFQTKVTDKIDREAVDIGQIQTDLSLLRKELKH